MGPTAGLVTAVTVITAVAVAVGISIAVVVAVSDDVTDFETVGIPVIDEF